MKDGNTTKAGQAGALALDTANFESEVLRTDLPVLVDFWAAWCAPCRAIAPVIESLAADYAGRAKVAKVDADLSPDLLERYGVSSIPTLIFFRGGEVVDRVTGAVRRDVLEGKLLGLLKDEQN